MTEKGLYMDIIPTVTSSMHGLNKAHLFNVLLAEVYSYHQAVSVLEAGKSDNLLLMSLLHLLYRTRAVLDFALHGKLIRPDSVLV